MSDLDFGDYKLGHYIVDLVRNNYSIKFSYSTNRHGDNLCISLSKEVHDDGIIIDCYAETIIPNTKEHRAKILEYIERLFSEVLQQEIRATE